MATKKGTAVAKKEAAAIEAAVSAMFDDAQEQGQGFNADDLAIPRISICQALTPQRNKRDPNHIEGLEEGMIFNSVLGSIYGEEVRIIPVSYQKVYLVWRRRESGGGFLGMYTDMAEAQEACPADSDVSDTAEYYVLIEDPETGQWHEASLSFKSTGMKTSRKWNSLISTRQVTMPGDDGRSFNPPKYAQVFTLSSVESTNDQGTWFSFNVAPGPIVFELDDGAGLYGRGKDFAEMVAAGRKRTTYEEPIIDAEVIGVEDADGNPSF